MAHDMLLLSKVQSFPTKGLRSMVCVITDNCYVKAEEEELFFTENGEGLVKEMSSWKRMVIIL